MYDGIVLVRLGVLAGPLVPGSVVDRGLFGLRGRGTMGIVGAAAGSIAAGEDSMASWVVVSSSGVTANVVVAAANALDCDRVITGIVLWEERKREGSAKKSKHHTTHVI